MRRIILGITVALFLLTAGYTPVFAEKKVVTAEGKYVMGDLDTKQNAKALALMDAKRMSLEQAGTYIESLTEVKDFQLSKDQINSLAAGILSVEILKEDWKMSGENMVVVLTVRATVDISNLKSRITAMQEYQSSDNNKEIKAELAALQKELAELKARQAAGKEKVPPNPEMKEKNEGIVKKMSALEYLKEGYAALQVQRWQQAIAAFSQAVEIDPKLGDAYAGLSIAYESTRQQAKAREMVEKALKLNPRSATGHFAMARILHDQRKYDSALESISRAIELNSKAPPYFFLRGEIHLKRRNPEIALKDFTQACDMNLPRACWKADIIIKKKGADMPEEQRKRPRR